MLKVVLNRYLKGFAVVVLVLLVQACTLVVPVDDPQASQRAFDAVSGGKARTLDFVSSLPEGHEVSVSKLPMKLALQGKPIEGAKLVQENLLEELKARGLDVTYESGAVDQFKLQDVEIISHRASGFSPMVTLSMANADVVSGGTSHRIVSFVKRGKVPVWSMKEINEPCYNQPVELVIKELAAKLNMLTYGQSLSDASVASLVKNIDAKDRSEDLAFMDVYELGFSNNKNAIAPLVRLTKDQREYVRLAALSSLGTLKATDQIDYLKSVYQGDSIWQDRAMALKAIGDMNTVESRQFLKEQQSKWQADKSQEGSWNARLISLYLE